MPGLPGASRLWPRLGRRSEGKGDLAQKHYLVRATGVRRLGRKRISSYQFSHNLFQKYLYHTLDRVERAYLHETIGKALETVYQGHTEAIAVHLASHFQEAGR